MKNRVISFHYTLKNPQGETIDSSAGHDPLSYIEGLGQIIPGLEKHLQNLNLNEKSTITIGAEDAYGLRDERFVVNVPLDQLPGGNIKVGDQFMGGNEDGHPFTVTDMTPTHATLDANHPLAGIDLTFDVEIVSVRNATDEELEHGHAHGLEGHDHLH